MTEPESFPGVGWDISTPGDLGVVDQPQYDLSKIESEVQSGLRNEQHRLGEAQLNLAYFRGEGAHHIPRRPYEDDASYRHRPKRAVLLLRRIVEVLADAYATAPARSLDNSPAADAWLRGVYRDVRVDALLGECDKLATVLDYAALQVATTGDPARPIVIHAWGADELAVFCADDDATAPVAVVTITRADQQTQYTLYTADEIRTYRTKKLLPGQTAGGRVAELVSDEPNPYGVLPFAWVHYERPTRCFGEPGPGGPIREANAELDRFLSDLDDWLIHYGRPDRVGYNIPADWAPLFRTGDIIGIPAQANAADLGHAPKVEILQPNLDIAGLWAHLQNSIEQVLHDLGVPLSLYRGDARSLASGVAIMAEQAGLQARNRRRRHLWGEVERDLARLVLLIGGVAYGRSDLVAAAADVQLTLGWPDPRPPVPTPELQAQDLELLSTGVLSKIQFAMRQLGLTEAEAIAHLRRVAAHRQLEAELLGPGPDALPLAVGETTGRTGAGIDAALVQLAAEGKSGAVAPAAP